MAKKPETNETPNPSEASQLPIDPAPIEGAAELGHDLTAPDINALAVSHGVLIERVSALENRAATRSPVESALWELAGHLGIDISHHFKPSAPPALDTGSN